MKKYRKKPVVIEAVEFTADRAAHAEGISFSFPAGVYLFEQDGFYDLETRDATYRLMIGDYIARGTKGEYYVIPGDVFPTIYEEAE